MEQKSSTDFRETYLNTILSTIENEDFVRQFSAEKAFTRERKLKFVYLVVVIMQGLQRSIQRELNSFYQKIKGTDFSIQEVTKSAFSHARKKLKWEAFQYLNKVGCDSFYKEAPYKTWNGFRLLAIDGSTLVLPNHPSIVREFGVTKVGVNADIPKNMARISMLYDVLNFTTLDAQIESYDTHERTLARKHFPTINPGKDLVIMDRGYSGFSLAFELQKNGIDYCIRGREDWWPEVKAMLKDGEVDKVVTIERNQQFRIFPKIELFYDELVCRIVIVTLPTGGLEILITSLVDQVKAPYESFVSLYALRWNIEEGYKLYKCRLQLEAWSGKTALAVKQDFYAKIFIMTTTAVLAFPIEEQLRQEQEAEKTTKHAYKVNRTNALSMVKESAPQMFIHKAISGAIAAFDKVAKATVEIVRPGRKGARKKTQKKPPSMNYKQL